MSELWRAQNYRTQAKSLRETAALNTSPEIRKEIEAAALRLELMAESIEDVVKARSAPRGVPAT